MSIVIKFFWKTWLKLNLLTPDEDNDYVAEVSTTGKTIHNADIAQTIIDEGSEIKYDTVLNILNRRDRLVRGKIQQGNSVQDGVCHIQPRVLGVWESADAKFSPETHKISVDMTMAPELREALREVGVEILGIKESRAHIGKVTDAATGQTDGKVTAGDDIVIMGDKIRIAPENDSAVGVEIISNTTGEVHRVTRRLTQNDPKKVIARLPNVLPGQYTLQIITRFSNGTILLNEPRTLIYHIPLTVE